MAMARPDPLQDEHSGDFLLRILQLAPVLPPNDEVTIGSKNLVPVIFTWKINATHVFLAGSFDNWRHKIPLLKSKGRFTVMLHVPVGTYYYLYCVNNAWMIDSSKEVIEEDGYLRNVITVKSDSIICKDLAIHGKKVDEYKNLKYGQEMPPESQQYCPPFVPVHMLQIILDKATNTNPALLPKPEHVLVNHLFVLRNHSQQNGLSKEDMKKVAKTGYHTITRFRKIFVTTVYYC